MTSMTQNRALSLVHPSVDTSTNHNIGSKSRVEEGHHYLDFRLTLDLVRQNILVSEECWAVEIKEEPNNDDVDNHKSTIETDFFSDT